MKKILFLFLLFTLFIDAKTYQEQWRDIKKLERENLPKSALGKVNIIYQQAVTEHNEGELIKALIHREKYQIGLQENGYVKSIKHMEHELTKAHKMTTKLILKSLLAEMYINYLDKNRYKIQQRTTIADDNSSDILTWSIDRLAEKSSQLYLDSLQDEAHDVTIENYKMVLHEGKNNKGLRPTLYDFLAFRALNHFNNERYFLTKPAKSFYIDEAEAFGNITTFINHSFKSQDVHAYTYQSLLIYQKLLKYNLEKKDTKALHHINFERLQFVYRNFIGIDKDKLYIKTLKYLQAKHNNGEAFYYLAEYYYLKEEYAQAIIYLNQGIKSQDRVLASRCHTMKNRIESQRLRLEVESVNLPNENLLAKLNYRNVEKIYLKVLKLTPEEVEHFKYLDIEKRRAYIERIHILNEFNITLPPADDYKEHGTEITLGTYGLGSYLFVIAKDEGFVDNPLYSISVISNIAYFKKKDSFAMVDRATGEPLQGVEAKFYSSQYDDESQKNIKRFISKSMSDKEGFLKMPKNQQGYMVSFSRGEDRLQFDTHYYSRDGVERSKKKHKSVYFFTDRAIYRPSQTIYFKGLAVETENQERPKILVNQSVKVTFYNTNHQKIESKKFKTNEYGTFNGSFTAPKSGLLGRMEISTDIGGQHTLRVEEYKRPKFEIIFKPLVKSYRLGDSVTVKGEAKAYSGYGLDGAKVKYTVRRRAMFPWIDWWRPQPYSAEVEIAHGEVNSNQDGIFEIKFDAITDKSILPKDHPEFQYELKVDITDSTGETRSNVNVVNIGYVAILADMDIAPQLDIKEPKELKLRTSNLNGDFQPLQGKIVIEKIQSDKRVYRKRYWEKADKPLYTQAKFEKLFKHYKYQQQEPKKVVVQTLSFDTKLSKTLALENLEQGEYLLTLHTEDKYGTKVKKSTKLIIYDTSASTPPTPSNLWSKMDKQSYEVGSTATLYLKSSTPNSFVLLTVEQKGKNIIEKWVRLEELTQELITITKESRGDIFCRISSIKNNRVEHRNQRIKVPWDNQLNVEFITFRDKLKPNSEEEWKIKISGKNKESVMAEMVATMYDASLDDIYLSNFNKPNLFFNYGEHYRNWWHGEHFDQQTSFGYWSSPFKHIERRFYRFNWFGLGRSDNRCIGSNCLEEMMVSAPMMQGVEVKKEYSYGSAGDIAVTTFGNKKIKNKKVDIRTNLKETMFFKPKLQTDKEGNIIINFKTNDALTRWNFLAFVHTKKLQMALVKKEIVTQKELMVVTNLPRFFREKDKIELSAKIVNMSSRDLTGVCELKLVNPIDEKPIYSDHNFSTPFSVKQGSSSVVKFIIKVPDVDKIPAIKHTIIAKTNSHTDAEQMVKPILSNRMFVTESKSLFIKGDEEKIFTLKSLKESNSTTLKNHKLTLEFSSNPAWYAVRSLPYLMEYPHACSEQLFSRYYANAIASKIANSSPKIKKIFEHWKSKKQLKSALSTNEALKSVLLEETPWVLNAQSEEEQQRNMGLLFDLVKLGKSQQSAYNKLVKRQKSDGGWAWFDGGKSNWYITQYIVEGFGKLKKMGINPSDTDMIKKAVAFMDSHMLKQYQELQKNVEEGHTKLEFDQLNSMIIHYLYSRNSYNFKMNKKVKQAHEYYLGQAQKYWTNKSLYEQGMIALTLDKSKAMAIVKSLKERALVNDELGMYFKYKNGFYWNEMPIETHALMIEVFDSIAHDKESVEKLKIWLLKNKQSTHWKTTKATVNAIYALLLDDNKWLGNDTLVDVSFETNITYQPILEKAKASAEKGTGYFKASFDKFDGSMATVKVKNPNSNIAWGSLYWHYFEELDKIKTFKETPLSIDKKLFLVKQRKSEEKLIPIEKLPLKVGDRIKVRIEIRVDRDMEYIMLKDGRASAFEPTNVLSQYKWQDGLGYYESTKDNATYFFMDYLKRGTYVFEYPLVVTHRGEFSNGVATIESMYAPEFRSHSAGMRIKVK